MYLSVNQVADELGVCPDTVRRYIRDGKIKAARLSERCIRVPSENLEEFALNNASFSDKEV